MLTNLRKNNMGTVSFDLKTKAMRKPQDFIVYPVSGKCEFLLIQSDTRIGRIGLTTGSITLTPPRSSGAYGIHLPLAKLAGTLSAEDLFNLKSRVFATAHGAAGKAENGFIQCDNSGALSVFQ